eukprot:CAMPEP_0204128138 /NCGR_PEP_ID=MMETSP0361-20130328/12005_1 /ASSEMBLY_ACC=CAM_ASM_000343 /TAXON_ID=268821 /ORGANISM="Scrippsiella Hangoei, Strain SHTV-5" /LENGTH=81 /DNA_ID=CAMNT_0051080309 /DNA_START=56 /DNA_END=298 /DNA_ORIENTATION=+
MCAPSSPAPSSKAVPDWASAMLTQTSSTDKKCRNDKAAEHTKTCFLTRPQPVLLSAGQRGTESNSKRAHRHTHAAAALTSC